MDSGSAQQSPLHANRPEVLPCLLALYPQGAATPPQIFRSTQKEALGVLLEQGTHRTDINILVESCAGIGRGWQVSRMRRQLTQEGFDVQLIGLGGPFERPSMLVPLRSEILLYVYTVAFRSTDSPVRNQFKRLVGFLPGSVIWRGPLLLVATRKPATFDRFVLLTGERDIAFLFPKDGKTPWAVRKAGAREELIAEHCKHLKAFEILGHRVPALIEMSENGATAAITLEWIPERFLGNVVSAAFSRKQTVFIREALRHLDFFLEVFRLMAGKSGVDPHLVNVDDVNGLLEGIDSLLMNVSDASLLKKALLQTIGTTLPRLMQHGDFCVRNVLIADGDRGRVLIDWEDLQDRRWPLVDFVLLRLSLKEVYADLFAKDLQTMNDLPPLAEGLAAAETELIGILNMDYSSLKAAQVLSMACLCRQNLTKGRMKTTMAIFRELMTQVRIDQVECSS